MAEENNFDVAVIGAGPAGMMAAGRAGELGNKVLLIEKNQKPGRKLLLTGKARCNITNAEFNLRNMVENYGKNGRFLFHAFFVFGPKQVIDFFEKSGLKTKTERGKRVFPCSDKSEDVLKTLIKYMAKNKVKVVYGSKVVKVNHQNRKIKKLVLENKEIIAAKNYIFCTGGKSFPLTGSTGDGFRWAEGLGHRIEKLRPVLVPIKIKEGWVKELQGLGLKNVEVHLVRLAEPVSNGVNVFQKGKKQISKFGECLFTHFGLSGPIILDISKKVGELLKDGQVKISLDLKPALDFEKLDKRVQRDFEKYQNRSFRNCLNDLLPRKLIPVIVRLSGIKPGKKANSITREERHNLVKLLKNLEMTPTGLLGFDSAIVTSGGISLKEIDDKTMKSKIIDNLFFAGEIIDVDGPSGGFNLQVCWGTGYLAGENAGFASQKRGLFDRIQ